MATEETAVTADEIALDAAWENLIAQAESTDQKIASALIGLRVLWLAGLSAEAERLLGAVVSAASLNREVPS